MKNIYFLFFSFFVTGCYVPPEPFQVFCVEAQLADVSAWEIYFDGSQYFTKGLIHSLPEVDSDYEIPLTKSKYWGTLIGEYAGIREQDNLELKITIRFDQETADYRGTIEVGEDVREIFCYW